jgi:hypothetical protein
MSRALWKVQAEIERSETFGLFYENEDAYVIVDRLVQTCDEHLARTSLEYLASASEQCILPPGLTIHPDTLKADVDALQQLFLRDFMTFNQPRKDLKPTKNELVFMALARAHYISNARARWAHHEPRLRISEAVRPLLDARIRLGCAMSVHGHLVKGLPYETVEQRRKRRQEERIDGLCPLDFTYGEWEEMKEKQRKEEAKDAEEDSRKSAVIREAAQIARHKKRKAVRESHDEVGELYPSDEDDDPIPKGDEYSIRLSDFPPPSPFPSLESLWDEVSYFLTCYWVEGPESVARYIDAHKDVTPSPAMIQSRDRLTNSASGGDLGLLWSDNAATHYLIMATQFFAQAWTEHRWKSRFPIRDVEVPDDWQQGFTTYVVDRLEMQLQDENVKEFSSGVFELLMPIGGRGLFQRLQAARGGAARKLVYRMQSVAAVSEIEEMLSTEAAIKLIGYDDTHPLYDPLVLMLVQMSCYAENPDFSMTERCMVQTSDLLQRGKALELRDSMRRPLIVRVCGEWMVHDDEWIRPFPQRFSSAWMTFLSLLKDKYNFQMDTINDLSYWEQKLGVTIYRL